MADLRTEGRREVRADPRDGFRVNSDADVLSERLSASLGRSSPKSPSEALQPEAIPPPPPRSRVARHPLVIFLNFVLTAVIVAVVVVGGGLLATKMQFDRAGDFNQPRTVSIDRGASLSMIAEQLQKEGIVSSKWLFMLGVWMNHETTGLKSGEYQIDASASMHDVMDTLVSGRGILYSITIPEGLTSQQIVDRLKSEDILTGDIASVPPEGALLPETYKFTRGDTRESVLKRMASERDRVIADVWARRAADLPIKTPEELVVLASIVEKETALADERSRIASVFINRLKLNMRLQSDPTVIYGLFGGAGKPSGFVLSRADLEKQSPYNTYLVNGLPPAPIDNPGRASLEAVANPSRTKDLFFVADGTGGHAFAETYEAHLKNVQRWRDISANAGAAITGDATAAPAADPGPAATDAPMALTPGQAPDPEGAPGQ